MKKLLIGDVVTVANFNPHCRKFAANNGDGQLTGELGPVPSGSLAVVVQVEKKGDKRPLLRFHGGGWTWANREDVERVR